jgi:hypothetical protein
VCLSFVAAVFLFMTALSVVTMTAGVAMRGIRCHAASGTRSGSVAGPGKFGTAE